MNFAVIENNIVINIVVGDSKEIIESVIPDKIIFEIDPENPIGIGYYKEGEEWVAPFSEVISSPLELEETELPVESDIVTLETEL